ncbi:group II intron reverse transcriptase/maturase [Curvibacter sp. AEP1-3]|uniref:group II intron reverse transcriptase/maturase n=1 Tax=Curvibacter sp. AEP1-3 TaxID=1844971 RepID=UPI00300100AA
MSRVVDRDNMQLAYSRVMKNRGAPGIDGMRCEDLKTWLKVNWSQVKKSLLDGTYRPQAVRRVDIPKPQGGVRTLGVPTVVDRLIQQALHQAMQPLFEPTFSQSSYGFRPGKSAKQAVSKAAEYIRGGKRWVVDMDLEKFFDRVNHDVLMARVARQVQDKTVLSLIRRFLEAGMMANGVETPRYEGTPQGGPLSPLLSNILLTDLDRELEARKLLFCRYADDCNIYVSSQRAGQRIMEGIKRFLANRLKLTVNETKSAVERPWKRKFLGYSVTAQRASKIRIAKESTQRLMHAVRTYCAQGRGRPLPQTIEKLNPVLRGWMNYFSLTQSHKPIEALDMWVRRRLRALMWRQWKRTKTRESKMLALGLDAQRAWKSSVNGHGPWWNAGAKHLRQALPTKYFTQLGLVSLVATHQHLQRPT